MESEWAASCPFEGERAPEWHCKVRRTLLEAPRQLERRGGCEGGGLDFVGLLLGPPRETGLLGWFWRGGPEDRITRGG